MRGSGERGERLDPPMLLGVDGITEVFLVRHARQEVSDDFLATAIGDNDDPPLSDLGRRQANATADHLAAVGVDVVYSSVLERARETAEAIAQASGVEAQTVEGIHEFEMFRDIDRDVSPADALGDVEFAGFLQRWGRTRSFEVWPLSEPVPDFYRRALAGIEGIVAGHRGKRIAVVSHGATINAYLGDLLGTDEQMFFSPVHASVSWVRAKRDRRVLMSVNEHAHIRAAGIEATF